MSMPGSVPKAKPGYASIGIPFDGMTLGTLRWFVRACGNAADDTPVVKRYDLADRLDEPDGIEVELLMDVVDDVPRE
jgi:hypothetical protein